MKYIGSTRVSVNGESNGRKCLCDTASFCSKNVKKARCFSLDSCTGESERGTLHKKRRSTTEKARARKCSIPTMLPTQSMSRSLLNKVDTSPNCETFGHRILELEREEANTFTPCFTRHVNATEVSSCSSVASCSSNESLSYTYRNSVMAVRKPFKENIDDDVESTCETQPGENFVGLSLDELAVKVHALELDGYRSTLHAFYASGPLNWEQEVILTDLRLSLNISNDEHLIEIRNILTSHKL